MKFLMYHVCVPHPTPPPPLLVILVNFTDLLGTQVKTGVKPYPLSPNHPVQHYHTPFNFCDKIE